MLNDEFNDGALAMMNAGSSPPNPFQCIGAQPQHAKNERHWH
jgi:hypothetical protein